MIRASDNSKLGKPNNLREVPGSIPGWAQRFLFFPIPSIIPFPFDFPPKIVKLLFGFISLLFSFFISLHVGEQLNKRRQSNNRIKYNSHMHKRKCHKCGRDKQETSLNPSANL
jgi:hypothetical protein